MREGFPPTFFTHTGRSFCISSVVFSRAPVCPRHSIHDVRSLICLFFAYILHITSLFLLKSSLNVPLYQNNTYICAMAKQYTYEEDNAPTMVNDDTSVYPRGITIPITLPTMGNCRVTNATHINWRDIVVSDRVKSMTLGPSELSMDTRSDKDLLAEALEEKYR